MPTFKNPKRIFPQFKQDAHGVYYPDIPHRIVEGEREYGVMIDETWTPINWRGHNALPRDFAGDPATPCVSRFSVLVEAEHVAHISSAVERDALDEKDGLMFDLLDYVDGDMAKAEPFFDSIPDIATADATRKRTIKDVLLQATARGLSVDKAQSILEKHGLPQGTSFGGEDERH